MYKATTRHSLVSLGQSLLLSALCAAPLHAQTIHDTQNSIHQLDTKFHTLQHHLALTVAQQTQLKQHLIQTDRLIKHNRIEIQQTEQAIRLKQNAITLIEQQISELTLHFKHLKKQLSKLIQARYQSPNNPPLAWLFLNPKQDDTNRLLSYYHYVIRANQNTIQALKKTQSDLITQQQQRNCELKALKELQAKHQQQQLQLVNYQTQRNHLLAGLSQQIHTQENTLTIYQADRQNLTQILRTLNQQSVIRTRRPMTRMKTKLPLPVQASDALDIQKINQGIVFFSPEASPVYAVYPGKVVFRDWLNGYGYLMIIDHGWGLMTLYANNLAFTKQKGDTVIQGEQIAKVGHSGTLKQSGLYFEVRRYGKAVPPLEWLKHH